MLAARIVTGGCNSRPANDVYSGAVYCNNRGQFWYSTALHCCTGPARPGPARPGPARPDPTGCDQLIIGIYKRLNGDLDPVSVNTHSVKSLFHLRFDSQSAGLRANTVGLIIATEMYPTAFVRALTVSLFKHFISSADLLCISL